MNAKLTERQIDNLVILQADDDAAWEGPTSVSRVNAFTLNLTGTEGIVSNTSVLSGVPVFRGTSVPVSEFLNSLEKNGSLDEFLKDFPNVKREQTVELLELFKRSLSQLQTA
jgi:uncharacterized protein (DUF433 family)